MSEIAKSDIFFIITSGSIILLTIVVLVALYYVVKILRDVEDITERVREEGKNIVDDVAFVRRHAEKGAKKVKNIIKPTSKDKEESKKK